MTEQTPTIQSIFPTPVYIVKRDTNLSPKEAKEIRKIIDKEGMYKNAGNSTSNNSYIFNGKLKNIKQFCEEQLNIYVKEVINPKEELDIYITQSWLNITKPGEFHHEHSHQNSIVSGVFYISTEEDDKITFSDPNVKVKELIKFEKKEYNPFNSSSWFFPSVTNDLVLFPSWLDHKVEVNEKATTDRISLSFNTFVRGSLGNRVGLTELVLK
tara:strand:+ start:56 stop:691 length:636 start_codon:yes stop_codon:yes gene_type:complete